MFFFLKLCFSVLPLITMFFKTPSWKKHLLKERKIVKNIFFSIIIRVYPIDNSYQTNQNFLIKTDFLWKKFCKISISFLSSVFRTTTYNYVILNVFGESHFPKNTVFLTFNFCLQHQFGVPHWWIIPKQSTFLWGEQITKKKCFSTIHSFSFLSSVVCTLTDNYVVQKIVHETFFRKSCFPEKYSLTTFIIPVYPVDNLYQTFQKPFFIFEGDSLLKKVLKSFFSVFRFLYPHWQQCPSY